ncbi:uncharacterized protein DUF4231 [Mycobacterium sp. BK558]|nr:uncharacterized protein DUF4231 [Mycobacterium sp. BK558]
MTALAAQEHWIDMLLRSVFAVIGAAILALAGVLQRAFLGSDQVKKHTTARAASESLKAEIYRYMVGVPPYENDSADAHLALACDRINDQAGEFLPATLGVTVRDTPLPPVTDIDDYVRERAVAQRDWHSGRVRNLEVRARRLRSAELVATAAAAMLAAVMAAPGLSVLGDVSGLGAWVGLATTVSSAVAAHLVAGRYDRLAVSYAHTATQLDRLIGSRPLTPTQANDAAFVDAVESVLAAQNGSWVVLITA